MQYVLFVFSARVGAMALLDYCQSHRVAAEVVNTPRELSASCGISLKIRRADLGFVERQAHRIPTYVGTYLVNQTPVHRYIVRLYD